MINFWIVVVIFSVLGLIFDSSGTIPGSFEVFLGNLLLYNLSYNGAWWFVLTYVLLVLISGGLLKVLTRFNPILVNIVFLLIYIMAFFQRIYRVLETNIDLVDESLRQLALVGTSVLPLVWGIYFYKYRIFSKIRSFIDKRMNNKCLMFLSMILVFLIFIFHCIFQNLIVAPFIGMIIIIVFNVANKCKLVNRFFEFLGNHSTNIWLTHMFFYSVLFDNLVFAAKYPLFILLLMLIITITVSYVINLIYKPLCKLVK